MAEEAAATGHSRLLALQQKQEGVLADIQVAQRDQDRQRTLWEQDKQQLQREHDELMQNIQVAFVHDVNCTYIMPFSTRAHMCVRVQDRQTHLLDCVWCIDALHSCIGRQKI